MITITWNSHNPPKRGVYRVKSDSDNPNYGYRYWHGDYWGPLSSTRHWCQQQSKIPTRRTPIRHRVLWASKVKD